MYLSTASAYDSAAYYRIKIDSNADVSAVTLVPQMLNMSRLETNLYLLSRYSSIYWIYDAINNGVFYCIWNKPGL